MTASRLEAGARPPKLLEMAELSVIEDLERPARKPAAPAFIPQQASRQV